MQTSGMLLDTVIERQDSFDTALEALFGCINPQACSSLYCQGPDLGPAACDSSNLEPMLGMPGLLQHLGENSSRAMTFQPDPQGMASQNGDPWSPPFIDFGVPLLPQPYLQESQQPTLQQQEQQQGQRFGIQPTPPGSVSSFTAAPSALTLQQPRRKVSQAQRDAHKRFRQRQRQQVRWG
jgi:hypothetical protein